MIIYRAYILAWIKWDASSFFEWLACRPWYMQILTDWVDTLPIATGDRALEVGCGPGRLTSQLHKRGIAMTGLDRSTTMVARARKNTPDCNFVEGDALALPLDDSRFDVAFAASVVNVVPEPEKLVNEMARVVRPGGRISVLFPTPALMADAPQIGKQRGLSGLSAAALATWAQNAPKRETGAIETLFKQAELSDVHVDRFFGGAVASVTGRVG